MGLTWYEKFFAVFEFLVKMALAGLAGWICAAIVTGIWQATVPHIIHFVTNANPLKGIM